MTTWLAPGPISHPWFRQPTSKRKLSAANDSPTSSRSRSSSPSPPPPKRRKHTILEAGFSSLSLSSAEPSVSGGQPSVSEYNVLDYPPMEDDHLAPVVVLPSSVEEPDIPEVKMKLSSWYEPEPDRIVVTSLESSDEEDEEELDADTTSISISPALLKKISNQSARSLITPSSNTSQALVLYKPLAVPDVGEHKRDENIETGDVVADDDAMDVEL